MGLLAQEEKLDSAPVAAAKLRITKILEEQPWLKTKPKTRGRRGWQRSSAKTKTQADDGGRAA